MNSGGHLLTTKKQKRFEIKRGGGGGGGGVGVGVIEKGSGTEKRCSTTLKAVH